MTPTEARDLSRLVLAGQPRSYVEAATALSRFVLELLDKPAASFTDGYNCGYNDHSQLRPYDPEGAHPRHPHRSLHPGLGDGSLEEVRDDLQRAAQAAARRLEDFLARNELAPMPAVPVVAAPAPRAAVAATMDPRPSEARPPRDMTAEEYTALCVLWETCAWAVSDRGVAALDRPAADRLRTGDDQPDAFNEVLRMVHAFSDEPRKAAVRALAARVRDLERRSEAASPLPWKALAARYRAALRNMVEGVEHYTALRDAQPRTAEASPDIEEMRAVAFRYGDPEPVMPVEMHKEWTVRQRLRLRRESASPDSPAGPPGREHSVANHTSTGTTSPRPQGSPDLGAPTSTPPKASPALPHDFVALIVTGNDAGSKDTISQCARCNLVRHDYEYDGGKRSPNYPTHHLRGMGVADTGCTREDMTEERAALEAEAAQMPRAAVAATMDPRPSDAQRDPKSGGAL